jgi:iron(II)-dependent oxidoreductase
VSDLAQRLAERLAATRERTFGLLEPLDEAGLARQPSPIMSPPLWDLGHIAAYEELWLVRRLRGDASLHPELETTYDAFETPRAVRGDAPILDHAGALAYLRDVRERALEILDASDLGDDAEAITAGGFVWDMVEQHEAQHTETVLQALQMLPAGGYRPPRRAAGADAGPAAPAGERVEVPGGAFEMGAPEGGFAYDCERPRHLRRVEPFLIARRPVTNGEHLAFMADGGYSRPELWTDEGWAWRQEDGAEAPAYWERDGEGGWLVRSYDVVAPVDPRLPVCHVSAHEADAHARWAGARLPTEAEWERAAGLAADPRGAANLDQLDFGPAPCAEVPGADRGPQGMIGDVWEWTSTGFAGYPGFRAFPYREYAEVFFGGPYRCLRGGSWATQPSAARTSFRNWDLPKRRQIFSGFRLVYEA